MVLISISIHTSSSSICNYKVTFLISIIFSGNNTDIVGTQIRRKIDRMKFVEPLLYHFVELWF